MKESNPHQVTTPAQPGWTRRQCSAISRPVAIHTRSRAAM
jgi:hypothetical protein